VLRVIVPVDNVPLEKEYVGPLELTGPDGPVWPGRFQTRAVGGVKGQGRPALPVMEALDGVGFAVPAWVIVPLAGCRIVRRVTIRGVAEDVAGMVGNDVEDNVDPLLMGGLNEIPELSPRSEMRIDVEEVLDAVAVVARLEGALPKDGADPQGGDAQPPEITEL